MCARPVFRQPIERAPVILRTENVCADLECFLVLRGDAKGSLENFPSLAEPAQAESRQTAFQQSGEIVWRNGDGRPEGTERAIKLAGATIRLPALD